MFFAVVMGMALFGQVVPGHPSCGLLTFSAAFLLADATMVAAIRTAAHRSDDQGQRPA